MKKTLTVPILRQDFRVIFQPNVPNKRHNREDLGGRCDPRERIIWISTRLSKKNRAEALTHEIIHAIRYWSKQYKGNWGIHPDMKKEEVEVDRLTNQFLT